MKGTHKQAEYENFIDFFRQKIAHITTKRIDGNETRGNRKSAGTFLYNDKIWQVNQDSHIEELTKAFNTFIRNQDPFSESNTRKNKGTCLVLNPNLIEIQNSKAKHIYIYLVN